MKRTDFMKKRNKRLKIYDKFLRYQAILDTCQPCQEPRHCKDNGWSCRHWPRPIGAIRDP